MQIFERFRRRWLERLGPWMLTLVFMYLLAIILLVLNSLNIRHQESLQQDRFQTYLLDVNAFKLEIDGIDEQIQHEMVVVDDLNHRVEFIQSQRILHRKKV